tara:strand:- start:3566 stop:4495 length:930 start_codon:yes stop_codon:yes gene_type:complete
MFNIDQRYPTPERLAEIEPFFRDSSFDDKWQAFNQDGYVIFDNVLSPDTLNRVHTALKPYFDPQRFGRNNFEGYRSFREYALLTKGDVFQALATHPLALAFAEAEFGRSTILSAFLAIELHPGETVQPWHADDDHCRMARPRQPFQLSAFWAIDDTTEENGATQVIPGSHRWDDSTASGLKMMATAQPNKSRPGPMEGPNTQGARTICLRAGALMLAKGTLFHRGGANHSQDKRLILTPQYSPGWVRPLENMMLGTPPALAAGFSTRLRELIGYSIHPPFMGYVDGRHPQKALDRLVHGERGPSGDIRH